MSEQYFLEKCLIVIEDAKASYAEMAHLDLEPLAKDMYDTMVADITRHLEDLNSRMQYLQRTKPPVHSK